MAIPVFRAGSAANIVHMGASFTTDSAWVSGATVRTPFAAVHRQRLQANIDRVAALAKLSDEHGFIRHHVAARGKTC